MDMRHLEEREAKPVKLAAAGKDYNRLLELYSLYSLTFNPLFGSMRSWIDVKVYFYIMQT